MKSRVLKRSLPDQTAPAFAVDGQNRVKAWNAAAERLLGRPAQEVEGRQLGEVFEARDAAGNLLCPSHCGLREMTRRGESIRRFALLATDGSGSPTRLVAQVDVAPGRGAQPDLVFTLMRDRRRHRSEAGLGQRPDPPVSARRDHKLTARQRQVLSLLADGRSTAQIAEELSISVNTVRNHEQNALRRLEAHSLAEAVARAIRRGLI